MDYNRLIFRKGGLWRKNDKPMVEKVTPREWGELLEVWESAVRATHDFLSEEDLQFYKKAIPERYLPELCVYCLRNEAGRMLGFLGVSASEIEMLFVRDEARGRGVGRELLEYATGVLGLTRLWVNSQNGQAAGFYRRMGFRETGRCERDPEGETLSAVADGTARGPVNGPEGAEVRCAWCGCRKAQALPEGRGAPVPVPLIVE